MLDIFSNQRVVLTADVGGSGLRFCGVRAGKRVTQIISMTPHGGKLDLCLANIVGGFARIRAMCPAPPSAISFAFPGPADYPSGIIGELGNLPGFRGGVALGPILQKRFSIPVFINNDGDLFAYGESIAGFLPHVNGLLEKAGNSKRYQNLLGVTLGTGFGGGIVRNGELFTGDNSLAGEIWLLRNKLIPDANIEESVSIRAVQRVYGAQAGIEFEASPEPSEIFKIGETDTSGNSAAAREAFRHLGEAAGDAMAQALTLVDGLAVIGGGLAGAASLFLPSLLNELNGNYTDHRGRQFRRLTAKAFNLEAPAELETFLRGEIRAIDVPGTSEKVFYDFLPRIGVGLSRLGTSEAVAVGAYAFALQKLNQKN